MTFIDVGASQSPARRSYVRALLFMKRGDIMKVYSETQRCGVLMAAKHHGYRITTRKIDGLIMVVMKGRK